MENMDEKICRIGIGVDINNLSNTIEKLYVDDLDMYRKIGPLNNLPSSLVYIRTATSKGISKYLPYKLERLIYTGRSTERNVYLFDTLPPNLEYLRVEYTIGRGKSYKTNWINMPVSLEEFRTCGKIIDRIFINLPKKCDYIIIS